MLKNKQAALSIFALCVFAMCAGLALYHYLLSQDTYDVKTVNGEQFTWQEKQNTWLVVNFFAQWCTPCIKESLKSISFTAFPKTRLKSMMLKSTWSVLIDWMANS